MAVDTKVWAVAEIVLAADKNTYEQDNFGDLQGNKAVIYSGTYTGDGSRDQNITGVGFRPIYVHISFRGGDGGNIVTHESFTTLMAADPQGLAIAHNSGNISNQDDAIKSLDADGFSVDDGNADLNPNTNGSTYDFFCIGQE